MGKMKDALIKLARKITGKEVQDENSISNVVNFMADNYQGGGSGSGSMLLDHDKLVEDNPDYSGTIYLDTVGVNAKELFDFVSNGGIVAVKNTEVFDEDRVVKIVYSTNVYFDDEISRNVIVSDGNLTFNIVLSNTPEPEPEPPVSDDPGAVQ